MEDLHFKEQEDVPKDWKSESIIQIRIEIMCFNQIQVLVIWNNGGPPLFQNQISTGDNSLWVHNFYIEYSQY